MDNEPDCSQAHLQGWFATSKAADEYAADIENQADLQDDIPRVEVMRCRNGGWNVWVWEE